MASVILIASRVAASAARSAASRCAAPSLVSRSALVVAAASDPLLPRRSSLSFYSSRSTADALASYGFPDAPAPGKVEFVAEEEDLVSDEAIWALYKRWCKFFKQERSPDEMARRFHRFKQTVLRVDSNKKACLPYRLEINWFADGKNVELVRPKVPFDYKLDSLHKTLVYVKPEEALKLPKRGGYYKLPEGACDFKKEPVGAAGEFEKEPVGAAGEFEKER